MSRSHLPRTVELNGPAIVGMLEHWFAEKGRTFPWRRGDPGADPYLVLVSEVMLQQTQTTRVVALLPAFLERFPTIESLAAASLDEVLRAWQGLGYNSRAKRLHQAARDIVEHHRGVFPRTRDELLRLLGIGDYTASAIACFAFGEQVPVVDVNVQRVLSRLFRKCHTVGMRASMSTVRRIDEAVMPAGGAYWWHQAVMDLGATICMARRPACERCPLVERCLSAYPRTIALHGDDTAAIEPMIARAPRRVWRGRIIERLRSAQEPLMIATLLEELPDADTLDDNDRVLLIDVIARLIEEGFIEHVTDRVGESATLTERAHVRLGR